MQNRVHYARHAQLVHTNGVVQTLVQGDEKLVALEQETRTSVIKVLLVDDHALVREGLRYLLSLQQEIQLVGEATERAEHGGAIRLIERLQPDIVLIGTSQQVGIDTLTLTRRITQTFPDVAVVLLTAQRSQQYIVQAFKCGARGYLLTSTSCAEITRALRIVHDGGTYIGQELAGTLANGLRLTSPSALSASNPFHESQQRGRRHEPQLLDVLTEKELELVRLIATGMSNKEIANTLAYSEKTVKNYLSIIFQKLNIRDRTQAAIMALKQGVLMDI